MADWNKACDSSWRATIGGYEFTLSDYSGYWDLTMEVNFEGGLDIYSDESMTGNKFQWAERAICRWLDRIRDDL